MSAVQRLVSPSLRQVTSLGDCGSGIVDDKSRIMRPFIWWLHSLIGADASSDIAYHVNSESCMGFTGGPDTKVLGRVVARL